MENKVTKKNQERMEITSLVLAPNEPDWAGEVYDEEAVLKAERNFSKYCNKANLQHNYQMSSDQAEFVESYITIADAIVEGRVVKKGSWIATMAIKSKELWDEIKKETFTGFSIGCMVQSQKIVHKAKTGVSYEGNTGEEAHTRLTDFNFKEDFCHVALVDSACNNGKILVMKSVKKVEDAPDINTPLKDTKPLNKNKQKEGNMSDVTYTKEEIEAMKAREVKLQEEVATMKAKQDADALLAEEIEAMKAKETSMIEELEAFKAKEVEALKAKEDAEKESFVAKAKEMVGICAEDKAEEFGADMFLIKSLAPEAFDRILEKLDAAEERMKKLDIVTKSPGSTEGGNADLEGEQLVEFKAKALMAEDADLKPAQARIQVRKKMRHDSARA